MWVIQDIPDCSAHYLEKGPNHRRLFGLIGFILDKFKSKPIAAERLNIHDALSLCGYQRARWWCDHFRQSTAP